MEIQTKKKRNDRYIRWVIGLNKRSGIYKYARRAKEEQSRERREMGRRWV